MVTRRETPSDAPVIARIVQRAFDGHAHSQGTEVAIIRNLRASGELAVSLVTEVNGHVRGYIAASPVQINDNPSGWYGLGPVAVDPFVQGRGLGAALVTDCLAQLHRLGAAGCVVLGEPSYYGRFGFKPVAGLVYPGPPPEYFMALQFSESAPLGKVTYHAAFASEA